MRSEKYFTTKSSHYQRNRPKKDKNFIQTSSPNHTVNTAGQQMEKKILYTNSSHSNSSELDEQLLAMNWNPRGQLLSVGMRDEIKIWEMLPSGLKMLLSKQFSNFGSIQIKFVNDNIFGCLSGTSVRFWDVRQGMSRQVSSIYTSIQQQWDLFDINHKSHYITLGGFQGLKNYDFRKLKGNDNIISQSCIEIPLFDIKWFQQAQQVLLAVGGVQNKGILSLYNTKLEELVTLQLGSSPIKSLSMDKKSMILVAIAQENTVLILDLPDIICCHTISLQEELNLYNCYVKPNGEKLALLTEEQVLIYNLKELQNPLKIPISLNTPISWHPHQDILAHVSKTEKNIISLTKIRK